MLELDHGPSFRLVVGENGSGKSHYLNEIAETVLEQGRRVLIVANTTYERFTPRRRGARYTKLSARSGRRMPENMLKLALVEAVLQDARHLSNVAAVLEYCGLPALVGVQVKQFAPRSYSELVDAGLSDYEAELIDATGHQYEVTRGAGLTAWIDIGQLGFERSRAQSLLTLVSLEHRLKRAKVLKEISLHLKLPHGDAWMLEASSGQLALIGTMSLIATIAHKVEYILIDEPENSLHPRWQREYVMNLRAAIGYAEPRVFIATHSPLIVSGAQAVESLPVGIVRPKWRSTPDYIPLSEDRQSVEAVLWQAFGTLTPQNHFLSEMLVDLLDAVANGTRTPAEVSEVIDRLLDRSYDEAQTEALRSIPSFAEKLAAGDVLPVRNDR